jgi:hypothetical protein
MMKVLGPFVNVPPNEEGERHLFYATSGRYPPALSQIEDGDGVVLAKWINGEMGMVYIRLIIGVRKVVLLLSRFWMS